MSRQRFGQHFLEPVWVEKVIVRLRIDGADDFGDPHGLEEMLAETLTRSVKRGRESFWGPHQKDSRPLFRQ